MGFSVRKRTKGKDSWLNFSFSKKGLHASHTMRFGNTTLNFGKNTRTTVNLGNGMRYIKTHTKPKDKAFKPSHVAAFDKAKSYVSRGRISVTEDPTWSSENIAMMSALFWLLAGLFIASITTSIIATLVVIQVAHSLTLYWKREKYPQEKLSHYIPSILLITPIGWVYILVLLLLV